MGWYDLNDEAARRMLCPKLTAIQLEVLWQLRITVWDGYLISKMARNELVGRGLATRLNGWQVITREGLAVLDFYGLLKDDRYGTTGGARLWTLKTEQFDRLRQEGLIRD
jgi:hypothetical protein